MNGYGHFGVTKSWQALKNEIWAYKLHKRVREVVAGCDICRRPKASPHPLPVYQPIISTGPNGLVAMDLCVFQVSDTLSNQEGKHHSATQPSVRTLRDRHRTAEADPY
ncbi:hypothetical protein CBL_06367 [Carabus blaptoides fortunei]